MKERAERIREYLFYKGISANQLEIMCGLAKGTLSKARQGKSDLGQKSIQRILEKCTDLNRGWLLSGEGDMLTTHNVGVCATQHNSGKAHGVQHNISNGNWDGLMLMLKTKDELIEKQQRTIDRLLSLLEKERGAT